MRWQWYARQSPSRMRRSDTSLPLTKSRPHFRPQLQVEVSICLSVQAHRTSSNSKPPSATAARNRLAARSPISRSLVETCRRGLLISGQSIPTNRKACPRARIVSPSVTTTSFGEIGSADALTARAMRMQSARIICHRLQTTDGEPVCPTRLSRCTPFRNTALYAGTARSGRRTSRSTALEQQQPPARA